MLPLTRYKTRFWGHTYICRPYLLETVFGDGQELINFEYMDDRPHYYVILVPTGTHAAIRDRAGAWYDDLLEDIEAAIEEEAGLLTTEKQEREKDRTGSISKTRTWPIPPDFANGSSWGEYTPDGPRDLKTIARIRAKNPVGAEVTSL